MTAPLMASGSHGSAMQSPNKSILCFKTVKRCPIDVVGLEQMCPEGCLLIPAVTPPDSDWIARASRRRFTKHCDTSCMLSK